MKAKLITYNENSGTVNERQCKYWLCHSEDPQVIAVQINTEKNPTKKIRIKELVKKIERTAEKHKLKEIILAFSLNAEGENTLQYVKKTLEPLSKKEGFTISTLGRGFSTGLELEYSDAETLENALKNRS